MFLVDGYPLELKLFLLPECLTLTLVSDKKTSYWQNRIVDTVSTKALLLKSKFAVGENLIFKGAGDFSSAVNLKLHGTE